MKQHIYIVGESQVLKGQADINVNLLVIGLSVIQWNRTIIRALKKDCSVYNKSITGLIECISTPALHLSSVVINNYVCRSLNSVIIFTC